MSYEICVGSSTLDEHAQQLEDVFARLAARWHSLKPSKVKLPQQDVEYLGHISTPNGVQITPVNLSLAELKRGQRDDAQCKQWRGMLETWKVGGAQPQDKPAEAREFALTDATRSVSMDRTWFVGDSGLCQCGERALPGSHRAAAR